MILVSILVILVAERRGVSNLGAQGPDFRTWDTRYPTAPYHLTGIYSL